MKIFILKTGLFTENSELEQAVASFEPEHSVEIFDAKRPKLEAKDWDDAVKGLVAANRVLTV